MKTLDPENRKHIGPYMQSVVQKLYDENKYRIE